MRILNGQGLYPVIGQRLLLAARKHGGSCEVGKDNAMAGLILLGERIDHLTAGLGVTDAQLATILGVQPRTVERWRAEDAFPQHESRHRLEALVALVNRLGESFTSPDAARRWLHSASGYFGGLAPMDALLRGRIDLVDAALEAMDSGVFV